MSRRGPSLKRTLLLVSVALALPACVGPHYCDHQIIGVKPCQISEARYVRRCLPEKAYNPVGPFAVMTGFLTTPFKCAGIFGWTDYRMRAEAIGNVVQARLSSDRFFTVDLALKRLRVDDMAVRQVSDRFIRAEVYQGNTVIPKNIRALSRPLVLVRGKLVWDGDGHLEIHPQHSGDYQVLLPSKSH